MIVKRLGRVDYDLAFEAMRAFTAARDRDTPDEIWLCEHPPVYTQGLAGKAEHVLDAGAIPVVQTNRGGQVTYHGPGQVVAYPLVDLRRLGNYVKEYVFRLEEAVLRTLETSASPATACAARPASTCGWTIRSATPRCSAGRGGRRPVRGLGKIAALGIKVSRHCTYHGVALNVAMDLRTLRAHQPVRLCRAENGRSFYNRRSRHLGRGGEHPRRASSPPTLSPR